VPARLLTHHDRKTDTISRCRVRHIVARTHRAAAQELDGEPFRRGTVLDAEVRPGAQAVRVPDQIPAGRTGPRGSAGKQESSSR
jgi:diacylglycerol kinase family enzyme